MDIDTPVPFREAVRIISGKRLMPTDMTSADLQGIDVSVRRQSFFSAQTVLTGYLDKAKTGIISIVNPAQVAREGIDKTVTEGFNPATLRAFLKSYLRSISYAPAEGEAGTIKDLSSDPRINLVVDTNVKTAHGAGSFIKQNETGVVEAWPALELVRFEQRDEPRNWPQRWKIAAEVAGDSKAMGVYGRTVRMVALKSSGIWQALGDGAGGYQDTLGNPYPPFAFKSGMWTEEIDRDEAIELGLMIDDDEAKPASFDFASLFATPAEA